jgi:hypothetical protein
LKAVSILSDAACLAVNREGLLSVLKKEADFDMAMYHTTRAQRILENEAMFQTLLILDRDDFGAKSAQYVQDILNICVKFQQKLRDLKLFQVLATLGMRTQKKSAVDNQTTSKLDLIQEQKRNADGSRGGLREDARYRSWKDAPARKANLTGTYFHRLINPQTANREK